ncbi:hypothetical protein M514_22826 [Trichuris suis]|uniref:Uncharacterized protein n=1 Tax=Trichuris suis TaxID=68888 RepID=A0A085N681_9BILA|nr:hypothetical protein M514_22826 [Trichuris suis]
MLFDLLNGFGVNKPFIVALLVIVACLWIIYILANVSDSSDSVSNILLMEKRRPMIRLVPLGQQRTCEFENEAKLKKQ